MSNQLSMSTNLEFQFRRVHMGPKHSDGSDEKLVFRSETQSSGTWLDVIKKRKSCAPKSSASQHPPAELLGSLGT